MKFKEQADKLYSKIGKEEVEGEVIYYRKRRVYPNLNEDGSINWFNSLTGGTWGKLALTILILLISIGFIWEYHNNLEICSRVLAQQNFTADTFNYLNFTLAP